VAPRLAHYQGRLTGGAAPLDEMTKSTDTRFVIITHNPITMARMNRLYGVTMAERGVSQLVSVDLEAAVRIRDEAVA
jgi:chromosome segregation protein